jgi:RNA polymerase sigma factor (sigma-70 family)
VTGTAARMQPEASNSPDERLVRACLKGDQEAWAALIDKYKNLIYSIPIKLEIYEDAADIFQAVCLDLLSELPRLREPRALPKWLMQTCYHKCLHQRRSADRRVSVSDEHLERLAGESAAALPQELLVQLEREQKLREVMAKLPERCRRMIHLLFFETPPRPYQEVARELGLATGSIGFIRGRCLTRLRKELEKVGFP